MAENRLWLHATAALHHPVDLCLDLEAGVIRVEPKGSEISLEIRLDQARIERLRAFLRGEPAP